MELILVAAV